MSERVRFTSELLERRPCADEAGQERRVKSRYSGAWICALEALTPVCIQSAFAKLTDKDKAFLPGSSLRGMVRNVAEVLGAGCAEFHEGRPEPPEILATPCTEEAACLVCRVFGFVHGDYSWAGEVRFHDTLSAAVPWVKFGLSRAGFGGGGDGEEGWRVFPHRLPKLPEGRIRCAATGSKFQFRVDYLNLDAEEYGLVKFALTLQHGEIDLCHKLGYQKAQGLGSVLIRTPNDKSAPIGPDIERYLATRSFAEFQGYRRYR